MTAAFHKDDCHPCEKEQRITKTHAKPVLQHLSLLSSAKKSLFRRCMVHSLYIRLLHKCFAHRSVLLEGTLGVPQH